MQRERWLSSSCQLTLKALIKELGSERENTPGLI